MSGFDTGRVLVFGCGRSHRSDDAAGLRAAEAVARLAPVAVEVVTSEAAGVDLLVELEGLELLIIVDAAAANGECRPGQVRCFDYRARPDALRLRDGDSTHTLGVVTALAVANQIGALPPNVWIYAVAADLFNLGDGLSESVQAAIEPTARRIVGDIHRWRRERALQHA